MAMPGGRSFRRRRSSTSKTTIRCWSRRYRPIQDSGGPGLHRGGAGIEKVYRLLEPGQVSIHDDREVVPPWGINGGLHGGTSSKWMLSAPAQTSRSRIPSKIDNLKVEPGDRIIYRTAGSGRLGRSARP